MSVAAQAQASRSSERRDAILSQERVRYRNAARSHRRFLVTARTGVVVGVLALWALASGRLVPTFFISTPVAVAEQLWELVVSGDLWFHGRFTLTATFLGFVLGAGLAIAVAWPIALIRLASRITEPYFLVAYSVPAVALGPVFILWFGIGLTPKVVLAAYFVFFIVYVNTVTGVQEVPSGMVDTLRTMGGLAGTC